MREVSSSLTLGKNTSETANCPFKNVSIGTKGLACRANFYGFYFEGLKSPIKCPRCVSSSRDEPTGVKEPIHFEHRQNSVSLGVLIQNVKILSLIKKKKKGAGVRIIPLLTPTPVVFVSQVSGAEGG